MVSFLHTYGYALIFLSVLAEDLGLPVPSFPVVVVAAATTKDLHLTLPGILLVSFSAALCGDLTWYFLGRIRGRSILRTLCSLSLNPDSCISRTENLFVRHGLKSLLVSKFVPGLSAVAPPLAGMLKTSVLRFLLFDFGGIILWGGSAFALGVAFHSQVQSVLVGIITVGRLGILFLAVPLAGWILFKWLERRRFYTLLERSRISASELKELLDQGKDVIVVDLRSELSYQMDQAKIPGALRIPPSEFDARYQGIPRGRSIVMYCT